MPSKKVEKPAPVYDLSWMLSPQEAGLDDVLKLFAARNRYDRGDSELSVTQLINSPQQITIERQNAAALKVDEDTESVFALLGKAVHKILEESRPPDSLIEERFFALIEGIKISGSADRVRRNADGTYTIVDYKLTSQWSLKEGPKTDWIKQLNMYAWLVEYLYAKHGVKVRDLIVVALLRDFSEARKQPYAPRPIVFVKIPLWTYEAREEFIHRRVRMHNAAFVDMQHGKLLPRCTPEETWDTQRAKDWVWDEKNRHKTYYMDEPRKCELYCPAKKWCAQFLEWRMGTTFATEILGERPANNIPKNEG